MIEAGMDIVDAGPLGQKKTTQTTAKATAVRLLARREHSAYEITQKLVQREFEAEEIRATIETLINDGWLSDERYAQSYIRMRQMKGFGPLRIKQELQERGVAESLLDQYLNTGDDDWLESLRQQYDKKFRNKKINDYADKAKRIRFLQYRGFSLGAIMQVVK